VIESGRQVLGSTAVALVESDHVEPGPPRFPGDAAHVMRVAAPFQAMDQDERGMSVSVRLPVAVAEELGMRRD
jgi:hypothetical protein